MASSRLQQGIAQRQLLRQSLHQIQLARLLEVPNEELEQYIQKELEQNEALEDYSYDDSTLNLPEGSVIHVASSPFSEGTNFHPPSTENDESLGATQEEREDFYGPYNYAAHTSVYELLIQQLGSLALTPRERRIAEYLIGNLDEKGFLMEDKLPRLARYASDELPEGEAPVSPEEIEQVLRKIQTLEPPGIGARSLQECLLLQAHALPEEDPFKPLFIQIFERDFALLKSLHSIDKIKQRYGLDGEQWKMFLGKLRSFSLAPAEALSSSTAPSVSPDFVLHIQPDGSLRVELLKFWTPRLYIRRDYKKILEEASKAKRDPQLNQVLRHVKERVERAENFIQLLRQREQTLLRTTEEIVRHQRLFFLNGGDKKYLRPLVLRQVAEAVGLDISTVSRVVNSKYIQTPWGIYPLKYFFSEGISTQSGHKVSNKAIKSLIEELIASENPEEPYSDEQITAKLQERGIQIKRRTVAKYREQLGILPARSRRRLSAR
ncbi:MAG: RNA polymerase factor sigma-54 [Bacteroidia bacterium]|nr:RNA polymerase factor sigma-54 [Bacteroidia bacterium]MDW8235974.1 RNA polymerase factor sigma-54 [Bacteroidia bacterium]